MKCGNDLEHHRALLEPIIAKTSVTTGIVKAAT